jgi:hypothetical protein
MGLRPTKGDEDAEWFNSWQAETPAPPRATTVGQAFPPANSGKKDPVLKGALPRSRHTLRSLAAAVR